jgi:hypothetical protein
VKAAELRELLPPERRAPILVLLVRWQRVYTALSVTAEAPAAAALDTRVQITTGKSDGSPPPRLQEEPPADRSRRELEEWVERLVADPADYDRDLARLRTICAKVERELAHRTYRAPGRHEESERERDRRCLTEYEGVHYADAAVREGCSGSWFRKLREQAKRDPRYGRLLDYGKAP